MRGQTKRIYEFGPFRLDLTERLLLRNGQPVSLTPKAFDTLLILVQNSGHLVDREDLMRAVWPESFVEEAGLTRNISVLRKALGEDAGEQSYIETVPKCGYRFMADVIELRDEGQETISRERARADETVARSIAVLPFRNLSQNSEDEYLGLGLADALITRLGNIRQLVIRPTSAVLKYTASNQDLATIGLELKVDSVLEGSVRRSGDRIRVTAQLVSVEDVAPLWTGKFDEKFTDALTVEDSISESVAEALVMGLTSEQKRRFARHYTRNAEAYQLYLKGRYYLNKRTKAEMRKAIEHFQQVIDIDPNYALAYAGLADCFTMISIYASGVLPKEIFPKAKAAAMKALEIDDTLAEAHTSLGFVRMCYDWNFSDSEREFKRAIDINPNFATAHEWYGLFLMLMGQFDESRAELESALQSDPLSIAINLRVGWPFFLMHRYDEAIEHFRKVIDMEPNYWLAHICLGQAYERKSMYKEAIAEIEKARSLNSLNSILGVLGFTYASSGRRAEAEKVLSELKEISKQSYESPYFKALIYTGLGENDLAFQCLEKAIEDRSEWMLWLKVHPQLESLHTDPRFTYLLRRIGFKTE